MPLTPGTRIGAYDVTGPLGAGGMGEVYRARDTRLDRDVALKVLPEAFTADPDRLARFEREARVLASLNHPNIAQIHGLEETGGARALVLELVEGPTLEDRLEQGPMPLAEVLSIARQIALALQAAHEAGVVHRDLKPANVKVREDGTVKVLDFGLAKALDTAPAPDADPLQSPTITASVTRMGGGMIMGTPAYMSPEQAEGLPTDTRGDLWSFGVVLYEMLSGERLFSGETVAQVLARVIDRDLDLEVLPHSTPAPVRRLLRRCLERDRRRRMRDAGEAVSDLEAAAASPSETPPEAAAGAAGTPVPPGRWRTRMAWAAAGLALGGLAAAAALWTLAPPPAPSDVRRIPFTLPTPMAFRTTFAVSPDGSTLVYVGRDGRTRQLMARRMDQLDAQPLAGTEGALDPFFSPDGEWIGFFAAAGPAGRQDRMVYSWALKKMQIGVGAPVTLSEEVPALGGSWGDDDRIVIGGVGGLLRVPAGGGITEAVLPAGAVPDVAICEHPHVLPDARAVLFSELSSDGQHLKAVSLPAAEAASPRILAPFAMRAALTPTGHLLFQQATGPAPGSPGLGPENLMAAPFDADRLELTGAPVSVVPDAGASAWSADGTLIYVADGGRRDAAALQTLVWRDRDGREEPIPAPPGAYGQPRIAPQGDRVVLGVSPFEDTADVLLYDLARDVSTQLTFGGWNAGPFWSPDGRRVGFASVRDGSYGLFQTAADGTGEAERLAAGGIVALDAVWVGSPEAIVFVEGDVVAADTDIHLLPMDGDGVSEPLIATEFTEAAPAVSPDGRWIAYWSDETGRPAVYVRPFPNVDDGKWRVSQGNGVAPAWSADGRELFYWRLGTRTGAMMAVPYENEPTFTPSRPEVLFEAPARLTAIRSIIREWDVAPDGERFLMIRDARADGSGPDARRGPRELVYVGNWFTELVERVPIP